MTPTQDLATDALLTPEEFLRALPKVNLHCHLQGAIAPRTVIELAAKHGLPVPLNEAGELFDLEARTTAEEREQRFFELLDVVFAVLRDEDDFARVAYELVRDRAAPHNVRYLEIFVPPTAFAGVDYDTIVRGLCRGLDRGEREFGVRATLIAAILREQGPQVAEEMVRTVIAHPHERVLGIALEGPEEIDAHRPGHFATAYQLAKSAGLYRTAHHTVSDPDDLEVCLDQLECDRIDHGYRILERPDIAERMRAEGRTVTVCPTITRVVFGVSDDRWLTPRTHPARELIEAGLPVSIGTDDECVVPCDITQEYEALVGGDLFDPEVAASVALQGAAAAWLPEREREQLVESFAAEIAVLRRRLRVNTGG